MQKSKFLLSLVVVRISFFAVGYMFSVPTNDSWVTDEAGIFTEVEEAALEAQLQVLEEMHAAEIAVLTVASLHGEDITQAAYAVASAWGIGKAQADNGILVLIAPNERERRIEVGYGLEGNVPDILAHRLGRRDLVPALRQQDYFAGTTALIESLSGAVAGSVDLEDIGEESASDLENFLMGLFVLLFIGFFVGMMMRSGIDSAKKDVSGAKKKDIFQSASFLNMLPGLFIIGTWGLLYLIPLYFLRKRIITAKNIHIGSGGGYGGGSFGGGFGGFGGGSFGGGGASGGW